MWKLDPQSARQHLVDQKFCQIFEKKVIKFNETCYYSMKVKKNMIVTKWKLSNDNIKRKLK